MNQLLGVSLLAIINLMRAAGYSWYGERRSILLRCSCLFGSCIIGSSFLSIYRPEFK